MADFNISANFNVNPQNRNYPTAPTSISFQAAQACRVTFTPSTGNCFGVASLDLAGGPDTTFLAVTSSVATSGVAGPPTMAAAATVGPGVAAGATLQSNPDTFDITFGN